MQAKIITKMRREDWEDYRSRRIGASDGAAILGVSRFSDSVGKWMTKTGRLREEVQNLDAVEFGNVLQPVVARVYAKRTWREVRNPNGAPDGAFVIHQHPTKDYLIASLDYEQFSPERDGPGCLEVKTGHFYTTKNWEQDAPDEYIVQAQHQMAVTGYRWATLAVLLGGQDFRWIDIERDDEFIAMLLEAEDEFWQCVVNDVPPEPNSPLSVGALAKLYQKGNGQTVALDSGEFIDLDIEYAKIGAQMKELADRKEAIKARIQAAMGEATFGLIPGRGVTYSWKDTVRKGYTVETKTYRDFRRKEKKT